MRIREQFSGLNMESLVGGPLQAVCNAQTMLAASTVKFIEDVDIKFDMEVKSSESLEKSSDESGELKDFGMPEGLARILDILATASTPTNIQNSSDVA